MRRYTFISVVSISVFLLWACSSEKVSPSLENRSTLYFPLVKTDTAFFKINNTSFNIFGEENSSFIQKEIIDSLNGGYAFVSVFKFDSLSQRFTKQSNYSIDTRQNKYVTNKNSVRKVEALFPFTAGTQFNENEFNGSGGSFLTVDGVDESFSIPEEQLTVDCGAKISSPTVFNNIQNNDFFRIYEKNVGLVYEFNQQIETQPGQNPIGFKNIKVRINF